MVNLQELRRIREEEKKRQQEIPTLEQQRIRDERAKMDIVIKHTGEGQFELVGATKDDVENNPKLMRRFERAITKYRCEKNDNRLIGGGN